MPTLINPCVHLSTCEPCCPLYDNTSLADLDASLDMSLVVVTRSSPRNVYRLVCHRFVVCLILIRAMPA